MRPLFVLRWAARDLRRRWVQVAAIALIIAIGTGAYSALGSTAAWRRESNDASYEQLAMYDLRVRVAEDANAPTGAMLAVLGDLPDPGIVEQAEERLIANTQVDATRDGETILVPGRIVGVDVAAGGPHVNGIYVGAGHGRGLSASDAGQPTVVLERNFAKFYDLPDEGDLRLAGGTRVHYVGQGLAPEYFFVMTEDGAFFAEANFAVVFAPLQTAQELADRPGRVNDLVLRLRDGVDPVAAGDQVRAAFAASDTSLGVTVMQTEDEESYRILYDDIESDQQFWNVFAGLILLGAAFGAFNLASRMVEAQRREIGVGMALGESPRQLALRPLLAGLQMSVLGALFGVGMGMLVILSLRPIYTSMLPLPVWHTDLQWGMFLQGAALGFVLPLVATAWPVWRAVRVMPVEAISVTHRTSRGGLAPLLRRLPWPRSAFRRMPLGNVLRTPRRTLLTALGIGAAIATLVAILGMLDSFVGTMERNDREMLQDHPDRVLVGLDRFVADDGPELAAIGGASSVGEVAPVLRVGGRLSAEGADQELDVLVEAIDLEGHVWAPTASDGTIDADGGGLVIAEKAAHDLGVGPGDTVTLEHPARQGASFAIVRTPMTVAAIHPSPFRSSVYVDRSQLDAFGATGFANGLYVLPAAGHSPDDVKRELFELYSVSSVQPVATVTKIVKDSLADFTAVFQVLEVFILLLVLLIAYNATSINADERARERATLFAFGLPLRRVIGLETAEGLLLGIVGTAVGLGGGLLVLQWVATSLMEATMPDMTMDVVITAGTVATVVLVGILAVAAAPLLTIRRLRRMDISGTLRVIE